MQSVIIDSNIVFSLLLSNNTHLRDRLFEEDMIIYAPNYLIIEIFRLKEKILKFTKLRDHEFSQMITTIFERIIFIGREYISEAHKIATFNLCDSVDLADTPFIALSLHLDVKVWSGDQKLKDGLKLKGFNNFY